MWIKFANLCRKNDRMWLAEKTINSLTQPSHAVRLDLVANISNVPFDLQRNKAGPHVVYAQLKFMWGRGDREDALMALRGFCEALQRDLPIKPGESKVSHQERASEISQVLARCYLKAGEWQTEMKADWTSVRERACFQRVKLRPPFIISPTSRLSFKLITPQLNRTPSGIKRGILGHWLISRLLGIWRPRVLITQMGLLLRTSSSM